MIVVRKARIVTLTETGESRVNGYLFVLERSLRSFLPLEVVRDAVREIESHVRERVAAADGAPNEREALEKILAELGPPLRVAQAYSAERTVDEAVATGRVVPMLRAVWHAGAADVRRLGDRHRPVFRLRRRDRVPRHRRAEADLSEQRRADRAQRRPVVAWRPVPAAARRHGSWRLLDHSRVDRLRGGRPRLRPHRDAPVSHRMGQTAAA